MEKILNILNWIGLLCGIYAFIMIVKLGLPILKQEISKFLRRF